MGAHVFECTHQRMIRSACHVRHVLVLELMPNSLVPRQNVERWWEYEQSRPAPNKPKCLKTKIIKYIQLPRQGIKANYLTVYSTIILYAGGHMLRLAGLCTNASTVRGPLS